MRRFKAGLAEDESTLEPLKIMAHRRFVGEIQHSFLCSCTASENGLFASEAHLLCH